MVGNEGEGGREARRRGKVGSVVGRLGGGKKGMSRLDITAFFSYLSKITNNLPEIYLSKSKITR